MFDSLTGRSWKPASSLATSGLVERMKRLMDSEIKQDEDGRNFVPHNIKLKMQWDKFSTDSEEGLKKLEEELLTAAVDHISDNRYYTHAPIKLEVKPDYFTEGVKLFVSFDQFDEERGERELNVTVPAAQVGHLIPQGMLGEQDAPAPPTVHEGELSLRYELNGSPVEKSLKIEQGKRLSVGRTKENNVVLDHTSVSKMHASLLLNSAGKFVVADTGSTNGTYLNDERIAYGKAIEIFSGDKLKFGVVDVSIEFTPTVDEPAAVGEESLSNAQTEVYTVGDMEFSKKPDVPESAQTGTVKEEKTTE
jgi:hypothetical protein